MTEQAPRVRLEKHGPIATIVLSHPRKLNAWNWQSARELSAHADDLRFDEGTRVVIVRAEGRSFCAGADVAGQDDDFTGRSPAETVRNFYERFRWVNERFNVLTNLPQPVLMAVQGHCLGAGLELAMMGDIRVAAEDASFGLPEARIGGPLDTGGDMRLVSEIGPGWTRLLAFTGRRIDAATALRLGIVQEVVARDDLETHVRALAQQIADNAPLAVQAMKRTINFWAERGMSEAIRFQAASSAPCFVSDDMVVGYEAASAKVKPEFLGK